MADDEREVDLAHYPALELVGQVCVGSLVLGDDDQARRVLIETVYDSRTALAADALDVGSMGEDGIGEGVIFISRSGMYGHTGGLVDDDEVFVLEHDGERNFPRMELSTGGRRDSEGDCLTGDKPY